MQTIGIMAGSGQFPFLVAKGAKEQGHNVVACGFTGNTDTTLAEHVDAFTVLPLGKLNSLIAFFKKHNVTSICMAGAINKPKALELKPDWRAAKVIFRCVRKGDDAILRNVAEELQNEGFLLVSPDAFAPMLLSPEGVLTKTEPAQDVWNDIFFGFGVAKHIGVLDVGQCLVVKSGMVVAVEAIEGTDATLRRAGELGGEGCTVIKIAKPGQDTRLDLPSIGSQTMHLLVQYKFTALAYEAGKTLFFDQEESITLANKHNITLIGLPEDPTDFFAQHKK